jgi:transposase
MAYSIDFREAAIKFKESGHSFSELKEVFGIVPQTYYNWLKLKEITGVLEARRVEHRKRKIDLEKLELVVKEKPDAYLSEIAVFFNCTPQAVFSALKRGKITYKKNFVYSERNEEARTEYLNAIAAIEPSNLVYVDESGLEKDYVREYGRAKRGVRVEDSKRGRKFQRLNVVAAVCGDVVLSPKCYTHPTTGEFFEDWFENELLPQVKRGQIIVMDNASFHRKKALRKIMRWKRKKLLFLPAYSPDFNKAEKKWANMKQALPDLIPQHASLEKAVYSYFGVSIL